MIDATIKTPKVYDPPGQCIYCGKRPPQAVLSKEHIIPLALGATFIFLKASCEECRKITHKFETLCLKTNFLHFRTHSNFPTRRPKERPTHLPIRPKNAPPGSKKLVPVADHPHILTMPVLPEPGILTGQSSETPITLYKLSHLANPRDLERIAAKHGGTVTVDANFNMTAFELMLAKIAHGFAWAEVGPENFKPALPPLIRGESFGVAYLVGQSARTHHPVISTNETGNLHDLSVWLLVHGSYLLAIGIRLFASFQAPTYCVIAGEFTPTPECLSRLGLVREDSKIKAAPQ
jgi:hypothetical protein